jgi:hypothetical protein
VLRRKIKQGKQIVTAGCRGGEGGNSVNRGWYQKRPHLDGPIRKYLKVTRELTIGMSGRRQFQEEQQTQIREHG